MDPFLRYARQKQEDIVALIREFVECESPSDDRASVNRFVELMAERTRDIAKSVSVPRGTTYGRHLRLSFTLGKEKKDGQILALGHSDTVWPKGTLAKMPFRASRGRLWGPGVLDMKAGMAFFIFAMRALRDLDMPVARRVMLGWLTLGVLLPTAAVWCWQWGWAAALLEALYVLALSACCSPLTQPGSRCRSCSASGRCLLSACAWPP